VQSNNHSQAPVRDAGDGQIRNAHRQRMSDGIMARVKANGFTASLQQ